MVRGQGGFSGAKASGSSSAQVCNATATGDGPEPLHASGVVSTANASHSNSCREMCCSVTLLQYSDWKAFTVQLCQSGRMLGVCHPAVLAGTWLRAHGMTEHRHLQHLAVQWSLICWLYVPHATKLLVLT